MTDSHHLTDAARYAELLRGTVQLSSARFAGGGGAGPAVEAEYSVADAASDKSRRFRRMFLGSAPGADHPALHPFPAPVAEAAGSFSALSPSGARRVVVHHDEGSDGAAGTSRLEIWDAAGLVEAVDTRDVHGKVYTDGARGARGAGEGYLSRRPGPSLVGPLRAALIRRLHRLLLLVRGRARRVLRGGEEAAAREGAVGGGLRRGGGCGETTALCRPRQRLRPELGRATDRSVSQRRVRACDDGRNAGVAEAACCPCRRFGPVLCPGAGGSRALARGRGCVRRSPSTTGWGWG